ncbi:MAG: tetratricopeptide repeat protein [Candidatus Acidoferrales bacterium]
MAAKAPDTPEDRAPDYQSSWQALSKLLHEDASFSGRERDVFFLNLGNGRFIDLSGVTGLDYPQDGRAFSVLDFDFDGDLDLIVLNRNAPQLRILRNDTPTANHSIAFRLRGRESNRSAVGALIEIDTPQGRRLKQVTLGSGFLSQSSLTLYFGLGGFAGPVKASITWPSGQQQTLTGLPADHRVVVVEGDPDWQATPFRPRNFDLSSCPAQQPLPTGVRAEGYPLLEPIPIPDFALKNLAGQTVTRDDFRARPLLLNFWATWCVPCQEEMRRWNEHYADLQAAGVELVAISVDEPQDRAQVEEFVRQRNLPFPVLLMDAETLRRYDLFYRNLFTRSTGLQIPTTFLIDEHGEVVKLYRGLLSMEVLQADLRTLRQPEGRALFTQAAFPFEDGRRFLGSFARDFAVLGVLFNERKLYADAIQYLEKQIALHPRDGAAWLFLGTIYAHQGGPERAREALQHAVELRPESPSAFYNLGMIYLVFNQVGAAEAALARAVQNDPDDPLALLAYGKTLILNGKLQEAMGIFETYLKVEPEHAEARNTLGILYARTGNRYLAVEAFARAVELKPDFAEAQKNLGAAALDLDRTDEAIVAFERYAELQPDDPDGYYLLARAYAEANRAADAKRALEKVLELRPEDARARRTLERLNAVLAGETP